MNNNTTDRIIQMKLQPIKKVLNNRMNPCNYYSPCALRIQNHLNTTWWDFEQKNYALEAGRIKPNYLV